MRAEEADILIIPGLGGSGPNHWQSRWQAGLKTARRVEQADWDRPDPRSWELKIREAVTQAERPVVLVAHSLGVLSAVTATASGSHGRIVAGFLVAPPDIEDASRVPMEVRSFAPIARDALLFPTLLVASRNDPYCDFTRAEAFARDWSAQLIDAGESGHVNPESGHGPWPEGLLLFSRLLGRITHPAKRFDG